MLIEVLPAWSGVVVRLIGETGLGAVDRLNARLREVAGQRPALVVIDLSETTTLSSLAITSLVKLQNEVRKAGGGVRLAAPTGGVAKAIDLTRLDVVFEVYQSVEGALTGNVGRMQPAHSAATDVRPLSLERE